MSDFRDCVYDRIHVLAKDVAKISSPENPARAPSTKRTVVAEDLKKPMCELVVLFELLSRTP